MQQNISLRLLPHEIRDENIIREHIAQSFSKNKSAISGFHILKQSIDARSKQVFINLSLKAFIDEPFTQRVIKKICFKNVSSSKQKVIIVGTGPAGLFAAFKLIELGIKPILLERGKSVRNRRRDLALLNREGIINPDSNYCFGEGGAGTYSDGKLYTRSSKRGDINRILNLFVQFGAEEKILYDSHPHIGTNKLPNIISAMRKEIIALGGEIYFEKKVIDFTIKGDMITAVKTFDGEVIIGDEVILATGHSARDIFELLFQKKILIEAKSFALGVRIEHPQSLIDSMQYHCPARDPHLPPSSYSLAEQVNGKGVFSFCMCPGGIIAPAATNPGELVVNGWSPSKRNNPFANSGMVVQVEPTDALKQLQISGFKFRDIVGDNTHSLTAQRSPLLMMYFQQAVEQNAFAAGGGNFVAPAQRMVDFCSNNVSTALPKCSYVPGLNSVNLNECLPSFIFKNLREGFKTFGKKMRGYYTNEAVIVATESRTSSPVRIPRNTETLQHPQIKNLYPCGEGAGYAGGIVSAAMDGEKIAAAIAVKLCV